MEEYNFCSGICKLVEMKRKFYNLNFFSVNEIIKKKHKNRARDWQI